VHFTVISPFLRIDCEDAVLLDGQTNASGIYQTEEFSPVG